MADRHKNKRRGPQGTGKPDPAKDRTAHEAAREKPLGSLRDLSKGTDLSEHIQDIIADLEEQSDRGLALIAIALVDVALTRLLLCRLLAYHDVQNIIFYNEGAPLGSFSSRIKMARAMGVVGPMVEAHLDTLRRIRNQFAHSPLRLDFSNPLISAEIGKLLPDNPAWRPDLNTGRRIVLGTSIVLIQALEHRETQHAQGTIEIWTN
jgi:hypothetical protein